jgi:hypothetical protein
MDAVYSAVGALAMGSPFLAILLILAYYYIFRVPWGRKRKPTGRRSTFLWSTAGLGTALLGLTLFYRPRLQFAVEAQERQVEDVDEDDSGAPDTPSRHFQRQLRRIRRGEEVESLSVRRE